MIDETCKGLCRILIWGAGVPNWVGIKDVIKYQASREITGTVDTCHSAVASWIAGKDTTGEAGNAQDMNVQIRKTLTTGEEPLLLWIAPQ